MLFRSKAYLFDSFRPTPELSFAIRHLGCQSGVNITASHNPKEYNGYKAYWADGAQIIAPHDVNIINHVNRIKSVADIKFQGNPELIEIIGEKMDHDFLAAIKELSLSPDVIKKYHDLTNIYKKLGVHSKQELYQFLGLENLSYSAKSSTKPTR